MTKLRMKILGCLRSAQRAREFAMLRSVLSTARKPGRNRIEARCKGRTLCWPPCGSSGWRREPAGQHQPHSWPQHPLDGVRHPAIKAVQQMLGCVPNAQSGQVPLLHTGPPRNRRMPPMIVVYSALHR